MGAGAALLGGGWVWGLTPCSHRQPKSGTVEDQFPVIRIKDRYYTMSLRMMKAVW